VNAPLFATFLLGMFLAAHDGARRVFLDCSAARWGAAVFHGLALSEGAEVGIKGGWMAQHFKFHSEMGQNFWMAIVAWTSCFVLTVLISLATKQAQKRTQELTGLVYFR